MITVIVIAYDRKEYLIDAVKSVMNQSLNKDLYEIIVIKNFHDKETDSFLKENNIFSIYHDKQPEGYNIIDALKYAKGDVIAFLEDDDVFENGKLAILFETFKDENIVFVHHNRITIDEKGNKVHDEFPFPYMLLKNQIIVFNSNMNFYLYEFMFGNLSASAIRTEILKKHIELLRNNMYSIDQAVFLMALMSGRKLVYLPFKLSRFRVHDSTSQKITASYDEIIDKNLKIYDKDYKDQEYMFNYIPDYFIFKQNYRYKHINNRIDFYFLTKDIKFAIDSKSRHFYIRKTISMSLNLLILPYTRKTAVLQLILFKNVKWTLLYLPLSFSSKIFKYMVANTFYNQYKPLIK